MSYVPPPVPERWDVGKWDQAHWDGQLGLQIAPAAVTITGSDVVLTMVRRVPVDTATVVVTSIDLAMWAGLSYPFPIDAGAITITGSDVGFAFNRIFQVQPMTTIVVDIGKGPALVRGTTEPLPGFLQFGHPHVTVPRRW